MRLSAVAKLRMAAEKGGRLAPLSEHLSPLNTQH